MLKRLFDFLVSFIFSLLLLPVFIIISIIIKTDSVGPVIYKQKRIGKGGSEFMIFKFRTMHINSDQKGLLTVGGRDPRVTYSGYFLRKYKLDELPQLFNVLFGSMSLVGPRPEVPKYVAMYSDEQRKVLSVKPGITDYASIQYSNESDLLSQSENPEQTYIEIVMPEKLKLNLKYIEQQSLFTDIGIIFRTVVKIIGW